MRLQEEELIDVAIDKKAFQSSFSKWSKVDDPQRAIDSNIESINYAFHTGFEKNPWWMVDLERLYPIELIRIFNRIYDCHENARNLSIEISIDKKKWILLHKGLSVFFKAGLEMEICLPVPIKARYVKITLNGEGYLYLSKVQVMIRKSYKPIFIAGRVDGLGCRIIAMLNAMYLAHKENAYFGYIWSEKTNFNSEDFEKKKETNFIGRSIGKEQEIFSQQFIKKYSYTNSGLSHNYGINAEAKINYSSLLREKNHPEVDYVYYISSVDLSTWIKEVSQEDYYQNIKTMWNSIEFSKDISRLIDIAKGIHSTLGNFISVHIRSGDIIVADGFKNLGNWWYKAMPLEIAMGIIESIPGNLNIVIFGDDEELIFTLEKYYYKKKKIFSVDSLFETKNLKDTHKAIFEIVLMSYSSKIYTGGSNFARLAHLIAFSKNPEPYFRSLSLQERYNYMKENLELIKLNFYQRAYSYFYIFMLSRELDLSIKERLKYIKKALHFDNNNDIYRIAILECLLLNKDYKKAEKYIKMIIKYRYLKFIPIFMSPAMVLRDNVFDLLQKIYKNDNVYLLYLKTTVLYLKKDISNALICFKNIESNTFVKKMVIFYMPGLKEEHLKRLNTLEKTFEKQP
ncbi:TPA: discoidin domain-containing protein, partial [Campylobacter jejuni]